MPLLDHLPQIDDRRYKDLVEELRTRIPRYTPEWTDLNDNDPGIALTQMFAWLADMLLYRLGQVPELNYLKFLELLGIELEPARPATTEIVFPLAEGVPALSVIVPAQTQVAAESDSPAPVVFETDRALVAHAAKLASVQQFDGYAFSLRAAANETLADSFKPFGPAAGPDSALYLGFGPRELAPELELDLAFFVETPEGAAVACDAPARSGSSRLAWEYLAAAAEWRPLSVLDDTTASFERSGHVRLRTPAAGLFAPGPLGEETESYSWIRARVERPTYEVPPRLLGVRTNTIPATQAQTIRDEVVGGSNGRRDQVRRLANAPVLRDTLELEIDEGSGPEPWTAVDDLFGSGPDDRHFVLNRTTGELRFGDGRRGAIPVGNPRNPNGNIVARVYRFGGGAAGNVAAGAASTLRRSIGGIDDAAVANPLPAAGGRDEETLDEARDRAPLAIRSRSRAVTAEDYEHIAEGVGTVRRAKALALTHPDFPDVAVPGAVTVIVVPEPGAASGTGAGPLPTEATRRAVCAALDAARPITTEVFVVPPTYHTVRVVADVVVGADADLASVKTAAEEALLAYLDPIKGGEDGSGWPFGGVVAFSRVYSRISLPGVARIDRVGISLDGREAPDCTNVPIPAGHLVVSGTHEIRPAYEGDVL